MTPNNNADCAQKNACILANIFNNQICKFEISLKHVAQLHLFMHMKPTIQYNRFPNINIQT